jgi:hypothetical protein
LLDPVVEQEAQPVLQELVLIKPPKGIKCSICLIVEVSPIRKKIEQKKVKPTKLKIASSTHNKTA